MDAVKPNRRKRSPTEDKQLSYDRDGRNCYGESPHAARKAIPRFKKASTRQMRHGAKQIIATGAPTEGGVDEARLAQADRKGAYPQKRKFRDEPLGARVNGGVVVERYTVSQAAPPSRNRRESVRAHQDSPWSAPVRSVGKKSK